MKNRKILVTVFYYVQAPYFVRIGGIKHILRETNFFTTFSEMEKKGATRVIMENSGLREYSSYSTAIHTESENVPV